MWKWIVGIVVVLVLVLAGGLYYVYTNFGSYVRVAIERYGSEATQSTVSVSSVTLKLQDGQGAINGIKIKNPSGFSDADAFQLGQASLAIDPQSAFGRGPIHIREVLIDGPHVLYEQGLGSSNLDTLKKNVQAYAAKLGNQAPPTANSTASQPKTERKLIIDDLWVKNGKVSMSQSQLQAVPGLNGIDADLGTIHLTGIGKAEGGASPAQVSKEVVGAITQRAAVVGAEALTRELVKAGALGKNGAAIGGAINSILGGH